MKEAKDNMIFFLQGTESYFIQQEIEKIVKQQQIDQNEIVHFSALEVTSSTLMLEMNSDDIFGMQKLLILKDLEQVKVVEYFANMTDADFALLNNSNNILVVQFYREEALSKTLQKDLKFLLHHATLLDVKKQKEQGVVNFLQRELKDVQHALTHQQFVTIAQKYQNNLELIANEVQRIKLEKGNEETITFDDFKSNSEFLEKQVFDLIQMLETQDTRQIFSVLDNMLLHQQNVFGLIALLLKNYKEMYQINALTNVGYNMQQIATRLNIHPYRTKLLAQSSRHIAQAHFPQILNKIIESEVRLKTGGAQPLVIKELLIYLISLS